MRSDKTDIDRANIEKYHNNQPVSVPPDIEHKTIIANKIHRIKNLTQICQVAPISFLHYRVPRIQRLNGIRMDYSEFAKYRFADNNQDRYVLVRQFMELNSTFQNLISYFLFSNKIIHYHATITLNTCTRLLFSITT